VNDRQPRSDGLDGLRVVRVLQTAQESLDKGGVPVRLDAGSPTATKKKDGVS
jgi:hypothetical protein